MLINLKVKTLDARTHEFSVDNEILVRELKDKINEKTNISPAQQRLIFCGRVLGDERQLKEMDLDGKVLHVAERPPPSLGSASSSSAVPNANNDEPERQRGMRTSPLFRALDSMVLGTMSIPVNPGNAAQMTVNPFPASPSFSMNRITVARHMLECANNIAAYLEDPQRGLNNSPLDILARGRWTMESTVVEMVQGALTTALSRQGNTNVTVVQLPTVYDTDLEEPPSSRMRVEEPPEEMPEQSTAAPNAAINTVTIEDIDDSDDDVPLSRIRLRANTSSRSNIPADNANSNSETNSNVSAEENATNRRLTVTRVLAEVIEQMRTVQTRLAPFIQQFYDQLLNDPVFPFEGGESNRENAQQLYDRVSEALHYMSHAQHAISDLMVDYSAIAPRFITCRPILVEQSGYVSSNAYMPNMADASNSAARNERARRRAIRELETHEEAAAATAAAAAALGYNAPPNANNTSVNVGGNASPNFGNHISEDPVDELLVEPPPLVTIESMQNNPDLRMAQIINSLLGNDADGPVQIEFRSGDDIELPTGMPTAILTYEPHSAGGGDNSSSNSSISDESSNMHDSSVQTSNDRSTNTIQNNNNSGRDNDSAAITAVRAQVGTTAGNANLARVTSLTLPTTSTQTRSTSRPQIQIGGLPTAGWNGRYIMSSFDRFLPCTSHHIRDPENANTSANSNTGANNRTNGNANANANANANGNGNANAGNRQAAFMAGNQANVTVNTRTQSTQSRGPGGFFQHIRPPLVAGLHAPRAVFGQGNIGTAAFNLRNWITAMTPPDLTRMQNNRDEYRRNLRTHLEQFLNERIFIGGPINEANTLAAINRAVNWFGEALVFLPQFERPEYDSRDSLFNVMRRMLKAFIDLMRETSGQASYFENELKSFCELMIKRMYSVMIVCLGRTNADMYWLQLMGLLSGIVNNNFRDEALQFLRIYINTEVPFNIDTIDAQQFIVERSRQRSDTAPNVATLQTELETQSVQMPTAWPSSSARAAINSTVERPSSTARTAAANSFVSASTSQPTDSSSSSGSSVNIRSSSHAKPLELREQTVDEKERNERETANDDQPGTSSSSTNVSLPGKMVVFPEDWNEVIAEDTMQQDKNGVTAAPLSDGYILGMTPKGRRQAYARKPPTNVRSLINESVRNAIATVGVTNSTNSNTILTADEITEAITEQPAVRNSLVETLRKNLSHVTQQNQDFVQEKYPQTSKFVGK